MELIRIDSPHIADTLITALYVIKTQSCPAMDSFNFSASVHHVIGRLRALCSLIADSQIALSMASFAVNEAIFLQRAPLRGN